VPRPGTAAKPVAGRLTSIKPSASFRSALSRPAAAPKQTAKQAHLRITKVDLMSTLKMSFLLAFFVGIVVFVSLFLLWLVLLSTGAIDSAQSMLNAVMGSPTGGSSVQLATYLHTSRVLGFAAAVSVINVFLVTLLGTIVGALYNLASVLFGGLEVTLEV